MASVALVINERKPIINEQRMRGAKTLFVYATPNWPGGVLAPYPSIPLDIIIEVTVKYGGVSAFYSFPLPNVGYQGVFSGDDILVNVYYTPAQGLPNPWPQYIINAGVIAGNTDRTTSQVVQKWAPAHATQYWPNILGWGAIPPFATEFRLHSNMLGTLMMSEYPVLAGTQWFKYYDWEECENWTELNPLAVQWRGAVEYSSYAFPWANERGSSILEFR